MELDQNLLALVVNIAYVNNERHISAALFDQDKRTLSVTEFQDNEHFSVFECLLLQSNPNSQDMKFMVLIQIPDLESEAKKVRDIFEQCELEVIEKHKREFTNINENSINKILIRPLYQYVQESCVAMPCVQCLLEHFKLYKDESNNNKFNLELLNFEKFMKLDLAAINALMIFPKAGQKYFESGTASTLVEYLDRCNTAMGKRCLRRWIKMPLQDITQINNRLKVVEYLSSNPQFRSYLQEEFLKRIPDLDKLYSRFYKVENNKKHNATLSDCLKVYQLLQKMHELMKRVNQELQQKQSDVLVDVFQTPFSSNLQQFERLESLIEKSIDLNKAYQGDLIVNSKFSEKLQQLSKEIAKTMQLIEDIRMATESDLGIQVSLTESGTHTYVFEAKKQTADDAFRKNPKKYKTLSVKNRVLSFTVEDLQAAVAEYNHLREEYTDEQSTVVEKILKIVSSYYPAMETASRLLSEIDVLTAFAQVAHSAPRQFIKPILSQRKEIILKDSRHPLLEAIDANCIMNDLEMERQSNRLHIITGPNMGGKSTYIRQVAICVLLAHIGSYVPCSYASIPIVDAIITRVGASDIQTRGVSTFMSEMLEASCMLKTAKADSLIIIDELGRGTSTSEGFGIAWAIAEHIAKEIQSYCLFATHFHEMTLMEHENIGAKNYYVSCVTIDDKITMQYKIRQGAVDRSYGLLVAEMLKFPKEVLDDAKQKALELETFEQNLESQHMEEEIPEFSTFEEELQYRIRHSTLAAKERVRTEGIKLKQQIDSEKNAKLKQKLIEKRKQIIFQLLK